MEERQHGDILEQHRHENYDYWHPATRVHGESTKDELPVGHALSQKPLAEKLILDRVEVTPIQLMGIGASLEIGAVQSLMEGLQHHRYAASTLVGREFAPIGTNNNYGLFYAEWQPNHADTTHRYLIEVRGEEVYVGYFPYDGRVPRLYGIHHKKMDAIKFLHKTHSTTLQIPELTLLTELNIPNISFDMRNATSSTTPSDLEKFGVNHIGIHHKQGYFYTRSFYGEFFPLLQDKFIPQPDRSDPKHPYYMFQGATGYIQLFEGKMFCYPDGSIRFLTKEQEQDIFRGYTDLQIVQGDLVAYELEGHTIPESQPIGKTEYDIDRHKVVVGWHDEPLPDTEEEVKWHDVSPNLLKYENLGGLYVREDCILTITHPEHGETKYEATKGEMLALLPGTSRPFQKDEGRD